ncbi:hydrogenase nickel incorporation protein HypA [Ignisphaera sp. 4213-co]|uniref:Hydrogenase nickel incorporation protein HypA n=1 Tax=Ignisphaera cupida TaxID=3050454 RepID=A0ABD4Z788_9CREN|nr:hydrogenase nickel incorporation protein HypA [Ignisphaera sp. 4213-co]MDK6029099.1 hydrogenase nickel incorporation protein HypA [Ignisphaera sp. 4213-co]
MHEWALAESVILTVLEKAKSENKNIVETVEIVIGELQEIDKDIFEFALNELKTLAEKENNVVIKNLKIVEEKAMFKCNRCNYVWSLDEVNIDSFAKESIHFIPEVAHSYIQCPKCGSHDFEIIQGRGVYLRL